MSMISSGRIDSVAPTIFSAIATARSTARASSAEASSCWAPSTAFVTDANVSRAGTMWSRASARPAAKPASCPRATAAAVIASASASARATILAAASVAVAGVSRSGASSSAGKAYASTLIGATTPLDNVVVLTAARDDDLVGVLELANDGDDLLLRLLDDPAALGRHELHLLA